MSRGLAIATGIELITETCCNCGVLFGFEKSMREQRIKDRALFYCPNGHGQSYTGDADKARLQKENERLQQQLEMERRTHASEIRGERIKRGKAEAKAARIEIRVNAGVCPHCNRTVSQLARHIKSKHPDQAPHRHGSLP